MTETLFFTLLSLPLQRDVYIPYISKSYHVSDALTPVLYFISICFTPKTVIYNPAISLLFNLIRFRTFTTITQSTTTFYKLLQYHAVHISINIINLLDTVK